MVSPFQVTKIQSFSSHFLDKPLSFSELSLAFQVKSKLGFSFLQSTALLQFHPHYEKNFGVGKLLDSASHQLSKSKASSGFSMAAVTSLSFSAIGQSSDRKVLSPATRSLGSNFDGFRFRTGVFCDHATLRASSSSSRMAVQCMSAATDLPTVADTKLNFLKAYKRPIPSVYNTVLQELLVQQHLMRYKKNYQYDPVFALGFVTVYDQLMEGFPSDEDKEIIFQAYIRALNEDPEQYRTDAKKLEEWARSQSPDSLVGFSTKEGEIEGSLKDIGERAGTKGSFNYSRFFAVGLFRLLELANASEPVVLEKLCSALNIDKRSVDRDLDIYRNLLTKLVQAKELLREYVDREKKKREERAAESQKANEAIKT